MCGKVPAKSDLFILCKSGYFKKVSIALRWTAKGGVPIQERRKLHLLVISALFAAAIAVMTAYLLHIPIPTGGYIHVGDALIYLAACLLPAPYAVGAAMVGAGLAACLLTGSANAFFSMRDT